MCSKKNNIAQFPHVKRASVEMSSPGLLFRARDMAGFWDVTYFRIRFGTYLDMAYFAMLQIWGRDLGTWILRRSGWLNSVGSIFSLSFVPSFLSFRHCCCGATLVVSLRYGRQECNAQALKYHSEACEEVNYCHGCQALATTGARQARRSRRPGESEGFETPGVSVQGICIQSPGVFKKAGEYCKFLNLSQSLCVFLYVVSFLYFFASTRADILICSLIFPVWRRSMEVLLDFCPFLVKWMHCAAVACWIQIIRRLFFCF